jgi:hypothetical protein
VPAVCAGTLPCRAPCGAVAKAHIAALDSIFNTRLQSCAVVLVVLLACLPCHVCLLCMFDAATQLDVSNIKLKYCHNALS